MIKIRPLEPWHIELLNSEGCIEPSVYSPDYARYCCTSGPAVVVSVDGVVCGAGGVIDLWNGVGEGWTIMSDYLRSKPVSMVKAFRAFFNKCCPDYKRLQITVEQDFEKARAFAEFLGFTPEGVLRYYSPDGKTHIMYSRIR